MSRTLVQRLFEVLSEHLLDAIVRDSQRRRFVSKNCFLLLIKN